MSSRGLLTAPLQSWPMQPATLFGKGTQEVVCVRFIELAENSVNKLRVFVHQAGISDSGDQRRGHDPIGVMILGKMASHYFDV